jgi:RNase P subunit RPR2
MKTPLSKTQTQEKINSFFKQEEFKPEQVRKIKRLAMKFKIRLKEKRKLFCKYCLHKLKGKTRINKESKTIICQFCNKKSKFKLS